MYAPQLEAFRTAQHSNAPGKGVQDDVPATAALLSDFRTNGNFSGRTVYASQLEAYRTIQNSTASGREIEAAALTRCALLLSDCRENWDAPGHDARLAEVLRTNQQVWSIFQAELTKKENPLPKTLKESILSLSVFIDKRIFQVMASPSPEKLQILIDINLNLAAGLRSKPAG